MGWKEWLEEEKKLPYYQILKEAVDKEYATYRCFPDYRKIYHAFSKTKMENVKVVILGQDPYHEINQAHGLAFSVLCPILPPSLQNIYKEMSMDLGIPICQDGNLDYLAEQGVLLLNTLLSVREGQAFSHRGLGWETLTDHAIQKLNSLDQPIVFILWGSAAQSKQIFLDNPKHLILKSAHPSPLSAYRGFFGSRPFSKTNQFLIEHNIEPIKWVKA